MKLLVTGGAGFTPHHLVINKKPYQLNNYNII